VFHACLPASATAPVAPVSTGTGTTDTGAREPVPVASTTGSLLAPEAACAATFTAGLSIGYEDARTSSSETTTEREDYQQPLVAVGVDDDGFNHDIMHMFFEDFLQADMCRSRYVGETLEEQDHFVDLALGAINAQLMLVAEAERRPVDIAILDQNLHNDVLGSSLAATLRTRGFTGVTCILTGSSAHSLSHLRAQPSVDLAAAKGGNMKELANQLKALARERISGR
jgi:hypothetical protein